MVRYLSYDIFLPEQDNNRLPIIIKLLMMRKGDT